MINTVKLNNIKKKYYLAGMEWLEWNRNVPFKIWMEFVDETKILSEIKSILVCSIF
jgi:hypothetical protein